MTGCWSALATGALTALAIAAAARAVPRPVAANRRPVPSPQAQLQPPRLETSRPLLWRVAIPGDHRSGRHLTAIAGLVAIAVLIQPALAVVIVAGRGFAVHRSHRRAQRRQQREVATRLPDLVDLLLLCTSAGLSIPVAHPLVAGRTDGPLGEALTAAHQAARAGRPRADCLTEALSPLGDRAARLAHVIVDHLRYGVPLAPGLERLGAELKLDRRRRAEEEARRVPVRLLAPLVACVLPAFGLLTVVPLLAASLRALPT